MECSVREGWRMRAAVRLLYFHHAVADVHSRHSSQSVQCTMAIRRGGKSQEGKPGESELRSRYYALLQHRVSARIHVSDRYKRDELSWHKD